MHRRYADLLRGLPTGSESVRQRQSNPRKVYPIDPSLIDLFDRRGQRQLGQRLETVVALELWRRGCSLSYGLTPEREEVDLVARGPDGSVRLVQVCVDLQDPATCARELRPLESLVDPPHRRLDRPVGVRLIPAVEWLLELG